ncbi:MerR family DNA-binding transcriptional regulator [Actinomadura yumaensis]|uniref:MerR family DNA-binding transcriptional regulator n=1 Tax=Actinomadura yumaensis TaxID=111807 RepID=UPI0036094BED
MARTLLTIGQVAERTGLSVHTLRFYEKEGLFATPVRRVRGNRVYGEETLRGSTCAPGSARPACHYPQSANTRHS